MKISGFSFAALSLIALTGCGHSSPEEARVNPHADLNTLAGPLGDTLRSIQTSEYAEACDAAQNDHKIELISLALNLENELKQSPLQVTDASSAPLLKFAGSYLINQPQENTSGAVWDTYNYSWQSLYEYYESHRSNPTRGFWTYLNSEARSLLLEDQRRVIDGVNDGINHENVEVLTHLEMSLSDCANDTSCATLKLDQETNEGADAIPYYHYFLTQLAATANFSARQKLIKKFSKRVHFDNQAYQEIFNPEIQVQNDGDFSHLRFSVDASNFGSEDQGIIKTIIESVWKTTQADLTLNFASNLLNPNLFKILFHLDRPGERDYVSRSEKTLNLFPLRGVRPIAHEFGHVLGFSDHYYTIWDASHCLYQEESNARDLMSDSNNGDVTQPEWKKLLDGLHKPRL